MKRKVYFICLLVILYFVTSFSISTFKKENVIYFGETTKVIVSKNSFKIVDDNKKINNKKVKILFNNKFIDAYLYSSNDFKYASYASSKTVLSLVLQVKVPSSLMLIVQFPIP